MPDQTSGHTIRWAVSLVFAYGHFNIPLGCEWVYMDLTYTLMTPEGKM